jgi:5'(3')-deoxyribonucleotidase
MSKLADVLKAQHEYNQKLRDLNTDQWKPEMIRPEWTKTYLLGMMTEFDSVLREINWKKHRKSFVNTDRTNMAYELADLTKYVLSLWELWGFTEEDIIEYVMLKSRSLELKSAQELERIPDGVPVVITDIDGTLGDWRSTFIEWLHSKGIKNIIEDPVLSMNVDLDLSMLYTGYSDLKEEFESSGKYRDIEVYPDAPEILRKLQEYFNAYIITVTARPSEQYKRIWMDTWIWLEKNNIPTNQLRIGSESRIVLAHELGKTHPVIMFDDNPSLLLRGANSGIKCFARRHKYNGGVTHRNIRTVDSYSEIPVSEYFPEIQRSSNQERKR